MGSEEAKEHGGDIGLEESPQLSPQGVPMELWDVKWEYHRYRYIETAKYDSEAMRGLGEEGWELVTVYRHLTELNFIFKRPKQN